MIPVLNIANLQISIRSGKQVLKAVRGVTFELSKGETLCLVGESGCGKSLTAKALLRLLPPSIQITFDRATLAGRDLAAMSEAELARVRGGQAAMVFQEPMTSLHPTMTIGSQLVEAYRLHRNASIEEARRRAVDMLAKVGITAPETRLKQHAHQLSGGMQQRVMIAMALICDPEILICDEPTTALDVTIQAQILRLLQDLQRSLGIAMIFITHDLGLVSRIADRVAVMYAGVIVEMGTVQEIFLHPRHPYTIGLLQSIPVPGRLRRGEPLPSVPGVVPTLDESFQGCAFRGRCHATSQACQSEPPIASALHDVRCWHPKVYEDDLPM